MKLKHMKSAVVSHKRVLVRISLNFDPASKLHFKLSSVVPTIEYLIKRKSTVILASHRGRPSGKHVEDLSLRQFGKLLSEVISLPVHFMEGANVISSLSERKVSVVLLENLRFFPGEETNDSNFSKHLASLADVFINEAFADSHRTHASTVGVTRHIPSFAGFLLYDEVAAIDQFLTNPKRPHLAIIGGKKTADKIPALRKLIHKVDALYLGGVVANTFLAALGKQLSKENFDFDKVSEAKQILDDAKRLKIKVYLPRDVVIQGKYPHIVSVDQLTKEMRIADIGKDSLHELVQLINSAKKILWNGPVGRFEEFEYSRGTETITKMLNTSSAETLIGGGDTYSAIKDTILKHPNIHFSTGGGALLEYIAKGNLPGLIPLQEP
jgi:phosphoglycerate kinase